MSTDAGVLVPTGAVGAGRRRANRFLIVCVAAIRVAQLIQAVVATIAAHDRYLILWPVVGALLAAIAWSALLFAACYRDAWIRPVWLAGDVAFVCAAVMIVSRLCPPTEAATWTNWPAVIALSSALVAGVALPVWGWLTATLLLTTADMIGILPILGYAQLVTAAIGSITGFTLFGAVAAFCGRYLRRTGDALDAANMRATLAEVERAAERARHHDRVTQYRRLHDTVLGTLTAIAHEGLDLNHAQLRARAAREADYVRRLLMGDVDADGGTLHEALGAVIEDVAALGLHVDYLTDAVPDHLPPDVSVALAEATREALTNVARHAGTRDAWLTSTGERDGSVIVRVADRGTGFTVDSATAGLGLQRSIRDRVAEAGGSVRIDSQPGEGTLVELRWTHQVPVPVGARP